MEKDVSMAERAGVGRGALSADSGRRSQEVGVGHPGGFVPEPEVVVAADGATLSVVSCGSCTIIQV